MLDTVIQIFLNSFVSALILSLVAIGFTYIFLVTKVFHLAHAGIYVSGAFAFWWVLTKTGNWIAATVFASVIAAVLIFTIEKTVYLPLNRKQSNQSISLIASMGLYVVIVNFLALLIGSETQSINNLISGSFDFGNIVFTKVQTIQTIVGIIVISVFLIYLKLTKSNLALQSVADNETISKVFGINTEKERVKVFIAGSVLACIAAILETIEVGIDPHAGMGITLTAAVVTILVARLNLLLITVFAFALTLLQNSVEWFLSAQWREGITFLILLFVILFKTEGIISYRLRKDRE